MSCYTRSIQLIETNELIIYTSYHEEDKEHYSPQFSNKNWYATVADCTSEEDVLYNENYFAENIEHNELNFDSIYNLKS